LQGKRTRDRYPLPLAPRKLVWISTERPRVETDVFEQLAHSLVARSTMKILVDLQWFADGLCDRRPRIE
jgi:hypothetical protein